METNPLTKEQKKALTKLGAKYFFLSVFSGVYHAALLMLLSFVITFGVLALELPEFLMYVGCGISGFFVFARMHSTVKPRHDTLILEIKKITESK